MINNKCERCGHWFDIPEKSENHIEDAKLLQSIGLCNICHIIMLSGIVEAAWKSQKEHKQMMDRLLEDDKICFGK